MTLYFHSVTQHLRLLRRNINPVKIRVQLPTMEQDKRPSLFKLPRWLQTLIVLAISSALVFLIAVLLGDVGYVSNLYFYATLILFIIAIIPIILEIVSSGKIASKAVKKNENVSEVLKEKQKVYQQRADITYVFGFSGIITFLLSIITGLMI